MCICRVAIGDVLAAIGNSVDGFQVKLREGDLPNRSGESQRNTRSQSIATGGFRIVARCWKKLRRHLRANDGGSALHSKCCAAMTVFIEATFQLVRKARDQTIVIPDQLGDPARPIRSPVNTERDQ